MTSVLPPLSKTHPTLWESRGFVNFPDDDEVAQGMYWCEQDIQETTIDKSEHERIVAESKNESYTKGLEQGECNFKEDVERLKKELEHAKANATGVHANYWMKEGIKEGERRAMQRAKSKLPYFLDYVTSTDKDGRVWGHDTDIDLRESILAEWEKVLVLSDKDDEVQP